MEELPVLTLLDKYEARGQDGLAYYITEYLMDPRDGSPAQLLYRYKNTDNPTDVSWEIIKAADA